jgi:hypothetical protein
MKMIENTCKADVSNTLLNTDGCLVCRASWAKGLFKRSIWKYWNYYDTTTCRLFKIIFNIICYDICLTFPFLTTYIFLLDISEEQAREMVMRLREYVESAWRDAGGEH